MRSLLARLAVLGALAVSLSACGGGTGNSLPFAGGPTGVFVPRGELEKFDLLNDTNRHLMRRSTLLTGSVSVYRPELRAELLRNALASFVGREREPRISGVFDQLVIRGRVGNQSTSSRSSPG